MCFFVRLGLSVFNDRAVSYEDTRFIPFSTIITNTEVHTKHSFMYCLLLLTAIQITISRPRCYKQFFMLSSIAEHEILNVYQEIQLFTGSDWFRMLVFLFTNV